MSYHHDNPEDLSSDLGVDQVGYEGLEPEQQQVARDCVRESIRNTPDQDFLKGCSLAEFEQFIINHGFSFSMEGILL